jgi:hypothetical protein
MPSSDPKSPPERAGAPAVAPASPDSAQRRAAAAPDADGCREIGGPSGPEPTRFGDWEKNGRCIDF